MKMGDFQDAKCVLDKLLDEESRMLFFARMGFHFSRDMEGFIDLVGSMYSNEPWELYMPDRMKEWVKSRSADEIVIYGAGQFGRQDASMLKRWGGWKLRGFCDNHKYGQIIDGLEVYSVKEAVERYSDAIFIIGSKIYHDEMQEDLLSRGLEEAQILTPPHKYVHAYREVPQYFDFLHPDKMEYFVDAGSYQGETIEDFIKWTKGRYGGIYAFEPMKDMYRIIRERYENNKKIEIFNYAVWDKKERLPFLNQDYMAASKFDPKGEEVVQGMDLDSALADKKVTFLKMDIEGSELRALQGAKRIIRLQKPRLAICIYHKSWDFVDLARQILNIVPDYRFYIRHYASDACETVLYAVC